MTTQQIFQPCQPVDLAPQSDSFNRVMSQARKAGAFAALAVVIATIPVLIRLLGFADISAFSPVGLALMLPSLAAAGVVTSRWASCSFVKEEESKIQESATFSQVRAVAAE